MKYSIDKNGFYGGFGGAFVPEMLYPNLEELEKNVEQLLTDALEDQTMTIRRVGVKVSDLSEIKGQSDITNFF